jgi:hypothetical protein
MFGCTTVKTPEVQALESQIEALGEISIDSKDNIESAEAALVELGNDGKNVSNINKLTDARAKLNEILEADINLKLVDVVGYALLKMAYIQGAWAWNINLDYKSIHDEYSDVIELNHHLLAEYLKYVGNDKYITSSSLHSAAGLKDTERDNVYLGAALGNPDSPSSCIEITMGAYDISCNVSEITASLNEAGEELKSIEKTSENYDVLFEYYQFAQEVMRNSGYPSGESYASYSDKVSDYKERWEKLTDTVSFKLG